MPASDIDSFVDALTLEGFSIGVRESLKVHQLAGILEENSQPLKGNTTARAMFTALIARDPSEQRRIAELYDQSIGQYLPHPVTPSQHSKVVVPSDPRALGQSLAAIAALLLIAVCIILTSRQPAVDIGAFTLPPGGTTNTDTGNKSDTKPLGMSDQWTSDTLYADLDFLISAGKLTAAPTLREMQRNGWPPLEATRGVQLNLPTLIERLGLPPDWPLDLNGEDVRRKIMGGFTDYGIGAVLPHLRFKARDVGILNAILADVPRAVETIPFGVGVSVPGPVSPYGRFLGLPQNLRIALYLQLASAAKLDARNDVNPDVIDRALAIEIRQRIPEGTFFADASWLPPKPTAISTAPNWLRTAAATTPFAILALWFLGLASRRRATIKRSADRSSPIDHRFVLEAPEEIRKSRTDKGYISRVAAGLNVRQTVAALSLDSERSVIASIAAGGLFVPVRGRITSTPAYLILIEARSAADHETRRLETLHRSLVDAGVPVKRMFYFDSPAWLYDDFGAAPRAIEDVAAHYEDRRLIIFGEGRGFLAPATSKVEGWARVLTVWPQRAMLTPRPLAEWSVQEFAIARELGLPIGRATVEGLNALAELLGLDEGRDRPLFRAYGFTGGFDLKPLPALIRSRPHFWLSEYDPGEADAARLDAVLRYYLDTEGLIWLKALAIYPALQWDLTLFLGRELALYHEPRLAALTLLPWLREGHMPEWLRRRFIATLPNDIRVRTIGAIHKIMDSSEAGTNAQLQAMRAEPLHSPSLRASEPSRDVLFITTLSSEGDFPAPNWLRPSLKGWLAALAIRDLGAIVLAFLYAAAAWWLSPAPSNEALGTGAYLPLSSLALLALIGWLGLTWRDGRFRSPINAIHEIVARTTTDMASGWKHVLGWLVRVTPWGVPAQPNNESHTTADPDNDHPSLRKVQQRKIFISYRRQDVVSAREIYRAVTSGFPLDQVFFDEESISPGVNVLNSIAMQIEQSDTMLLLISESWLAEYYNGTKSSWLHLEVGKALDRGVPIVPVLLNGVHIPLGGELPGELEEVFRYKALSIDTVTFDADLERLTQALKSMFSQRESGATKPRDKADKSNVRNRQQEKSADQSRRTPS